ncbi:MAG: 3-deoxy-7-phosphoheptulonate synthase [Ignavibacteriales bacterium]|nr:3-deoxy-7-phosphoheptulonate synthase [Ignavibacteriales bacterium]
MEELRDKINSLDVELIDILSRRRDVSRAVAERKLAEGKPIRDVGREEALLKRLVQIGKDAGLDAHYVTRIFHEVIDDSLRVQRRAFQKSGVSEDEPKDAIRVAIQGIEGSYSFLAAKSFFSDENDRLVFVSKNRFTEVVAAVEREEADYAMLPVENTTSGGINEVYDALLNSSLSVVGEEKFHVRHCLVAVEECEIGKITRVFAHQQAAAQCGKFLSAMPNAEIEYVADTARSVQRVKELANPDFAAIAGEEAADLFNLKILRRNIANQSGNYTRFLVGAREAREVAIGVPCKTSLVMSTKQEPGALVEALNVFRKNEINMTKLQSQPILGNPWEEMFYVDFEGNVADERVTQTLDELGRFTKFFKTLGSYPTGDFEHTKIDRAELLKTAADATREHVASSPASLAAKKTGKVSYKLASRQYKEEDTVVEVGGAKIGGDNFVVMAGPCAVESREQIAQCALHASETGAHVLRGGCFKPRTSPYSFQGLGFKGLEYLKEAGEAYSLPIVTEVLATEQVAKIAESADILQVGARNMQNFSLLKEVGKTHRPVFLKRGMMASIDELLNAAEYVLAQGNRQVILCERGIRTFETATRNTLDLSAIPVLKELTHLPIVVDPSHALGERDKVAPLAKAAKIVGAHGVMVEFHPNPSEAKSDGPQSLYFDQFERLMKDLVNL